MLTFAWLLVQLLFIAPFTIGPLFRRLLMEAILLSENDRIWTGIFSSSAQYSTITGENQQYMVRYGKYTLYNIGHLLFRQSHMFFSTPWEQYN